MYQTMENTKHLLKQKIDEVINKGDISPSEMDCVYKAYKTLGQIATIEAMEDYTDDYSYGDNSYRNNMSRRRGNNRSYDSYEESMRRGRGADGRFVSRNRDRSMDGDYDRSYDDGYSNHSVHDRMIASLEREMDMAKTDYERQQIQDEIRSLRERQK